MKETIEAYKDGDVKHPKHEIVQLCRNCGFDITQAEKDAGVCSDCGNPLEVRQSVSIWATTVPKAGGKTMGQT